ncbi:hypothetical protein, partial [Salmonella enterica]|uniref:hypothetical protein n=1 Tax=Salmonella enterica TaxID=28901 RepID=UPI003F1B4BED
MVEIVRIHKQKKALSRPRLHSNPMANTALILDELLKHFCRSNPRRIIIIQNQFFNHKFKEILNYTYLVNGHSHCLGLQA